MTAVRTVALEFLRNGPPHNQLLSALTNYLAVLGDHKATTINVPYEGHAEFLQQIQELSYPRGQIPRQRLDALDVAATRIARLLENIDGFSAELRASATTQDTLLHLKFIISANELALLPFELAKIPPGALPTAGPDWLAMIPSPRVCITRQIRSVTGDHVQWPGKPRVLFAWAAPELAVPEQAHTLALLDALRPWVSSGDTKQLGEFAHAAKDLMTILPRATLKDIREACSKQSYTHVHILAHGYASSETLGSPVGIGLHSTSQRNRLEVVLGKDFVDCLGKSHPVVVTVSACDSGMVRSVVHETGVSFAHDLHRAGIPVVIASQFPLTKQGSVELVSLLYKGLLWAEDPRDILHKLRARLFLNHSHHHDWASLIAYTALPANLESQLVDARYRLAKAAIDAALNQADKEIERASRAQKMRSLRNAIPGWSRRIEAATSHMPLERKYGYETEGHGLLGSAQKRIAEALFAVCRIAKGSEKNRFLDQSIHALENSLEYYERAFKENIRETLDTVRIKRSVHWVLCQHLSLRAVLGKPIEAELWGMARITAEIDRQVPKETDDNAHGAISVWAHGTLWELYLLVLAYKDKTFPVDHAVARARARDHIKHIGKLGTFDDGFPIHSTRRQIVRYLEWWCHEAFSSRFENKRERDWNEQGGIKELAGELVKLLPEK
ncbi:hypothetical protein YTPLAS18_05480 [Nitrospira sp.]|nr:hypothetical protein YTPLAS18_05480 [Nitrospira sp.]